MVTARTSGNGTATPAVSDVIQALKPVRLGVVPASVADVEGHDSPMHRRAAAFSGSLLLPLVRGFRVCRKSRSTPCISSLCDPVEVRSGRDLALQSVAMTGL